MEVIIYICSEMVYYLFLSYLVTKFNSSYLANSCILLFFVSLLIAVPPLLSIKLIKNRKKHFFISTVWIIFISLCFYLFRNFSKYGILNFTFHLYSILFMLIPFLNMFILSIHKLYFKSQKKKQLGILIVSKKILLIIVSFIFSFFFKFETLIISISILDFILNLISPFLVIFC